MVSGSDKPLKALGLLDDRRPNTVNDSAKNLRF
jgi:hypothetical protein